MDAPDEPPEEPELPEGMLDPLPPEEPDEPEEPDDPLDDEDEDDDDEGAPPEELLDDCWLAQPPMRNADTVATAVPCAASTRARRMARCIVVSRCGTCVELPACIMETPAILKNHATRHPGRTANAARAARIAA